MGMSLAAISLNHFGRVGCSVFIICYWYSSRAAWLITRSTGWIHIYHRLYFRLYNTVLFLDYGLLSMAMKFCWKKVSATQFTVLHGDNHFGFAADQADRTHQGNLWLEVTILAFAVIVCELLMLQFHENKSVHTPAGKKLILLIILGKKNSLAK